MSSSATMQQAKTDTTQPAQPQQSNARAVQSEFADLRPQATAQRQLQDTANNSPQSRQLKVFQQMAQNSARATQLKAMSTKMNAPAVQRLEDDAEPLQTKSAGETAQREAADAAEAPQPNNTGLPDHLKSGIESLSGMSMDHVKVHYNSAQPAQLNAHAYAQGSEIHVAPGQERHLPHEAWHVVQQAQGRVQPTMQMKAGVPVNDDVGLEAEADVMGTKALGLGAVQMRKEGNVEMSELTSSLQAKKSRIIQYKIPGVHSNGIKQFAVDPQIVTKADDEYTIRATGSPSDFTGGAKAIDTGIGNVQSYNATIKSTIKKKSNGSKFTTGAPFKDQAGVQDNTQQGFAKGHIVGNAIGGPGEVKNIFEQDAGQNNSGEWKSFEKRAKKLIDNSHDESLITYEATLGSAKLKYWF